ncbi:MAG TPA: hypothetical protein VL295_04180 [Gemmatimonadales bacterium]|nr:hypothetical protein [Gemmatimonadales bacterium]
MRRATTALLIGLVGPTGLAAQRVMPEARLPLRCAAYDSLLAGATRTVAGPVAPQTVGAETFIPAMLPVSVDERQTGIAFVSFTVRTTAARGLAGASLQVNAQTVEQEERPITERQGRIVLDDSITIDLGTMSQSPGATFPSGTKTWYLYATTQRAQLVAIARAKNVYFKVGSSSFQVPVELVDRLRGAVAVLSCR